MADARYREVAYVALHGHVSMKILISEVAAEEQGGSARAPKKDPSLNVTRERGDGETNAKTIRRSGTQSKRG
jgi:hypothetical protein